MRLFITPSTFLSVIPKEGGYSCQLMELVHGIGMHQATFFEDQRDVVSAIVHVDFLECSLFCKNLEAVAKAHEKLMKHEFSKQAIS